MNMNTLTDSHHLKSNRWHYFLISKMHLELLKHNIAIAGNVHLKQARSK